MKRYFFQSRLFVGTLFLSLMFFACLAATARAQSVTAQYATISDYGSGFQGQITINNGTAQAINGWTLAFDFDRAINSI